MKRLIFFMLMFCTVGVFAQVQYIGGNVTLEKFLKEKTVYPAYSKYNCIQGKVEIAFKVNLQGEIYSSKINSGIGTDLDDEALRLIRLTSRKWKVTNAQDTASVVIIPVSFVLDGYGCERKSADDIKTAILAYQAEVAMENAVINFYKHKDKATEGQEAKVLAIKNQLGIDDDYLQDRIKSGLEKLKQGDKIGACEDFNFVKNMGSNLVDNQLKKYCN